MKLIKLTAVVLGLLLLSRSVAGTEFYTANTVLLNNFNPTENVVVHVTRRLDSVSGEECFTKAQGKSVQERAEELLLAMGYNVIGRYDFGTGKSRDWHINIVLEEVKRPPFCGGLIYYTLERLVEVTLFDKTVSVPVTVPITSGVWEKGEQSGTPEYMVEELITRLVKSKALVRKYSN